MANNHEKINATVLILTHNEECHIGRLLDCLGDKFASIIVIDSGSTDKTKKIAEQFDANIIENEWPGSHSAQINWAIKNIDIKTDWIIRLDADEIISSDVLVEIKNKLNNATTSIGGFIMKRGHIFLGKRIKHGGTFPTKITRIWRTGHGKCDGRLMDERIIIDNDFLLGSIDGVFWDHNLKGISEWIKKHNEYASKEAVEQFLRRRTNLKLKGRSFPNEPHLPYTKKFFEITPLPIRSLLYFLYRYILKGGFFDGLPGFFWHFLQGFWYRLLVDVKVTEIEKLYADNDMDIKDIIYNLTNYEVEESLYHSKNKSSS